MVDASLTEEGVVSIRRLAFAGDGFEPYPSALISATALENLVLAGLAESGQSCRPAVGAIGYRLTAAGWRAAESFWAWNRPTALMFATPPSATFLAEPA